MEQGGPGADNVRRMARNAEVIRQWGIVRRLDGSRQGGTVRDLARACGVSVRTIWRDVAALQEAGFPLYDELVDGRTRWRLSGRPLGRLHDTGLSLAELAALYFSRTLAECVADTPFQEDVRAAVGKIEAAIPPRMRQFLDRLPGVLGAKADPQKRRDERRHRETIARLLGAILHRRRVRMRYHSFSSRRTKAYFVDPHRIVYAHGGLYLFAEVEEYRQPRTFAMERIQTISVLDETFEARDDLPPDLFGYSLGVHVGRPERVEVEFLPDAAPYVRERIWHASQRLHERADGSLTLTMDVVHDWALKSWLLSFGPLARVVSPSSLAEEMLERIEEARERYVPSLDLEVPPALFDVSRQPDLPFRRGPAAP